MPRTKETRAEMLDAVAGGDNRRRLALFVGSPVAGGTEVTGTGYADKEITMGPADDSTAPVRRVSTSAATWNTGAATDWPAGVNFIASYNHDRSRLLDYQGLEESYDMSKANQPFEVAAGDWIEEELT